MKRILTIAALVAFITTSIVAETQKREFRAVWFTSVANIDWPPVRGTSSDTVKIQQESLLRYLDGFREANFNAVCFQVRSICDAMYNSEIEPWTIYLTGERGKAPSWDPLQFIVDECHKRGMELHCWVNPYRFASGGPDTWCTPQDELLKQSGTLLSYTNENGRTTTILNPAMETSRRRIVDACREMITKYDVDGLIFDDYFYPDGTPTDSLQQDYPMYVASGSDLSFADWRREQVNLMVRDVHEMIERVRPEVRFGIGPAGVAGTAATSAAKYGVIPCPKGRDWQYDGIYSDPLAWLSDGSIDYISPQLYWSTTHATNPFGPLTNWWSYCANHFGRHHYASQNIYFMERDGNNEQSWQEIGEQIRLSRDYNLDQSPGYIMFSSKYISGPHMSGLGSYLRDNVSPHVALPPALTWKTAKPLGTVQGLRRDGQRLYWTAVDATLVKYVIYAIPNNIDLREAMSNEFDGLKSDFIVAVTYGNEFVIDETLRNGYRFAVTILDAYNNEYDPQFAIEDK